MIILGILTQMCMVGVGGGGGGGQKKHGEDENKGRIGG
jgi:hypothetical protein